MATWFTADLHFGHTNIIRYCDRPFADVEAMNEALFHQWNREVRTGDTVWVLGDFALGAIADTLPLARRLNGRKLLLAGNHDRCWAGNPRRVDEWTERYLEAGFDEIHQGTIRLDVGAASVLACHFPYRGDSGDRDRFVDERPADTGDWLLHGHVHERWRQNGRMINVGVEAWGYAPVNETELARIIAAGPSADEAPSGMM